MGGLIATGRGNLTDAMGGFANTAVMRQKRDAANAQLRQAEQQQKTSAAASGAMVGTMIYPGIGTVIGGALGYLTAEIF